MTDAVFWIWMQEAIGAGNIKADEVIRVLGTPEALYRMSEGELADSKLFAPKEAAKIKATGLEGARTNLELAKRYGCVVWTPDHPDYPMNLANIDRKPCVLYGVGNLAGLDDELILTLVGTRSSNAYGETSADKLAFDLAAAGCTIASGLAVGIDYAAHEGALRAGARTIGLLACGMNVDYPSASRSLKHRILDGGGALLTEFPFWEKAHPYNFNIRNRLLSGIASGVVVVQAPEQSGALNTARHALEQNRDVFAVPGEIFDSNMAGCNKLIGEGAKIVINVFSILEEYIHKFPDKIDPRTVVPKVKAASGEPKPGGVVRVVKGTRRTRQDDVSQEESFPLAAQDPNPVKLSGYALERMGLSEKARAVYEQLEQQPEGCDQLSERTGLSPADVLSALTELELSELARAFPGQRYAAAFMH